MKKILFGLCFAFLALGLFAMGEGENTGKPVIAVSIVPEASFVKAVAGDDFQVFTVIPPGNSPANYQPTPKEKATFSKAVVYFSIGVPTEKANVLKSMSKNTKLVELAKKVNAVYPDIMMDGHDHCCGDPACTDHQQRDPHIWLSPRRAIIMIEEIKKELSLLNPSKAAEYEINANKFIAELKKVDVELKEILKHTKNKSFFVFHPAFGYFADDYGLKMYSLEQHGKEATAEHMMEMVKLAKEVGAKAIFYQAEIDSNQSKAFAEEIDGKTIQLQPLSPDYIENLKKIAKLLAEVNE